MVRVFCSARPRASDELPKEKALAIVSRSTRAEYQKVCYCITNFAVLTFTYPGNQSESSMPPSHKTQLAIVGMGRWGERLVRSVQDTSESTRFSAVVSTSPERVAAVAADLGLDVLPDLETAIADPTIDGIVIATPHSRHAEAIAACRRAGKPVLVEKPFTLTRASADTAVAAGSGLCLAAHNRRFLPAAREVQKAIAAGDLGTVLHMEANFSGNVVGRYVEGMWRSDASESPAGGLAGSGIHMIDLMIGYAGPITAVHAVSSRRVEGLPVDDTMVAIFRFAAGGSAVLSCVTASTSCFRLKVFGTAGSAELHDERSVTFLGLDGTRRTLQFPPLDIERAELEAFAAAIRGEAAFPVTLDEVLNGVSAFEGVSRSLDAGATVTV
jgi:predicted dehydrogenase